MTFQVRFFKKKKTCTGPFVGPSLSVFETFPTLPNPVFTMGKTGSDDDEEFIFGNKKCFERSHFTSLCHSFHSLQCRFRDKSLPENSCPFFQELHHHHPRLGVVYLFAFFRSCLECF